MEGILFAAIQFVELEDYYLQSSCCLATILRASEPPLFHTSFRIIGKMKFGEYPEGYNRHIHGPFDPARYYGKPDTPFPEVRLLDLPSWLSRRSWNPVAWGSAVGRSFWRWQHKWIHPKRAGAAGIHQFCFITCTLFYFFNYQRNRDEMNYKYH